MKRQRGFSILNIMIAISVMALLTVTLANLYQQVNEDSQAKALIDDTRWVLAQSRELRGVGTTSQIGAVLNARGLIPNDWEPDPGRGPNWFNTRWGVAAIGGVGSWFDENPSGINAMQGTHLFLGDVPLDICFDVINTLQAEVDYISYGASRDDNGDAIGIIKTYNIPYDTNNAHTICEDRSSDGRVAAALRLAIFY